MPQFRDLLFRRAEPVFYAFDILWDEHAKSDDEEEMRRFRNGRDATFRIRPAMLRSLLTIAKRKSRWHAKRLRAIDPDRDSVRCSITRVSLISKRHEHQGGSSDPLHAANMQQGRLPI